MKKTLLLFLILPVISFAQSKDDAIDLGLSVKWAAHNIGASLPEQCGDLFAWGEITTKTTFTQDNYKYKDGDQWTIDIGENISSTEYDAAKAIWGGEWRLPTYEEALELNKKCEWEYTVRNAIPGYEVTGPNGNSIFLPIIGDLPDEESSGEYWTGTLAQGLGRSGVAFWITEEGHYMFGKYKIEGKMIRPVMTNENYVETITYPIEWRDKKYADLLQYIQDENYEQAFIEASVLAGSSDAQAQCVLASMYFYEAGTYRNYEAAQEQLALAAAQGSERAEYMMGGFGSLEKSHEFMQTLTGKVDLSDDINFWNQMMSTETKPTNYKEAFRWFFLQDGEWGYRDIMYYCGIALNTGAYGYQNQEHGLKWIVKSAQLGYYEAIDLLDKLKNYGEEDQ